MAKKTTNAGKLIYYTKEDLQRPLTPFENWQLEKYGEFSLDSNPDDGEINGDYKPAISYATTNN